MPSPCGVLLITAFCGTDTSPFRSQLKFVATVVNVWRGFEQTNIQVYHGTLLGYGYMRLIFMSTAGASNHGSSSFYRPQASGSRPWHSPADLRRQGYTQFKHVKDIARHKMASVGSHGNHVQMASVRGAPSQKGITPMRSQSSSGRCLAQLDTSNSMFDPCCSLSNDATTQRFSSDGKFEPFRRVNAVLPTVSILICGVMPRQIGAP